MYANDCPFNLHTCAWAAKGGHLAGLQWARASGCPWSAHTCGRAAKGGYLAILQWARANGCPWNLDTCNNAADGEYFELCRLGGRKRLSSTMITENVSA